MAETEKKASEKLITIVIVTYNRPKKALAVVKMLKNHNLTYEIIVVDQEKTSLITDEDVKNLGFIYINLERGNISRARNEGLLKSTSGIVLFIDDDIEISENSILAHIANYDQDEVVAVSGRVISDGEKIPENSYELTGKTNFLGTKFLQQFWSTKKQEIEFLYGCNMSFRKVALIKVGGFDENFNRIFDDIDIGFRIKKLGKIIFDPMALAYHHKAETGGSRSKSNFEMLYMNYGYYLGKNITFPASLLSVILRSVTVLKESPQDIFIFLRSYFLALKSSSKTL